MPVFDTATSMMNCLDPSGKVSTGPEQKLNLRYWNAARRPQKWNLGVGESLERCSDRNFV